MSGDSLTTWVGYMKNFSPLATSRSPKPIVMLGINIIRGIQSSVERLYISRYLLTRYPVPNQISGQSTYNPKYDPDPSISKLVRRRRSSLIITFERGQLILFGIHHKYQAFYLVLSACCGFSRLYLPISIDFCVRTSAINFSTKGIQS